MNRAEKERLQAALTYMNAKAIEEDCIRRLENRALVVSLRRNAIREAWLGGAPCQD